MRLSFTRGLAALVLAGALTTVGAPAAAARQAPAAPALTLASALSVSLSCQPDAFMCQSYASGGSGGYTFTWTNAYEYYSEPGYSEASPYCPPYTGGILVRVKVTDGTGAIATAQWPMSCSPEW